MWQIEQDDLELLLGPSTVLVEMTRGLRPISRHGLDPILRYHSCILLEWFYSLMKDTTITLIYLL